ncbi:putative shugoshin [Helianthus anomalus]
MNEDFDQTPQVITQQKHDKWSKPKPQESQRMSFGRPPRKVAGKIHSYKETPLNIKMRRPE